MIGEDFASDEVTSSLEQEVQDAVDKTGFGKFNYGLFAISASIFMNTAIGISSTGLIVPAAACDLQMNAIDKGRLTAAPMLGLVCGSYFWGYLADARGRKPALLTALFLDGLAGIAASVAPNLLILILLRFVNGFAGSLGIFQSFSMCGETALAFPYLGEFQPTAFRDKMLCWMEVAWAFGLVILPLAGWAIIPLSIEYRWEQFSFSSWNLFILVGAMLPIFFGIVLTFFPESPKYLAEDGQGDRATQILARIYAVNTGNPTELYPVKFISSKCHLDNDEIPSAAGSTNACSRRRMKKQSATSVLRTIWRETCIILKPPYLKTTLITCIVHFIITSSYYTLMVRFPGWFQKFTEFEARHTNESASVCVVTSTERANETTMAHEDNEFGCGEQIQDMVFIHTLALGLSCIPTSLFLPLGISRFGYRFFLLFSTILSSTATIGLFFVTSSTQNLILSCIFESVSSMGATVILFVMVESYPTHLRAMAGSFSAFWGRSGSLVGNLLIGHLLDINCIVSISYVAAQLLLGVLLCCFLPGKKKIVIVESSRASLPITPKQER